MAAGSLLGGCFAPTGSEGTTITGATTTEGTSAETTGPTASSSASATTEMTTQTSTSPDTSSMTGASSTGSPGQCGDGVVQPPEQCDDENSKGGDGCDATCQFEYRIAFVSSMSYLGEEIGDIDGGDDKCNSLAGAANQLIGRTFRAWLSTEDVDAKDRIGTSTLPYRLADQVTVVASDTSTFSSDMLLAPIDRDEKGEMATGEQQVWTGTLSGGTKALDHCSGWTIDGGTTGLTGLWSSSSSAWTAASSTECTVTRRIYCIEYPS